MRVLSWRDSREMKETGRRSSLEVKDTGWRGSPEVKDAGQKGSPEVPDLRRRRAPGPLWRPPPSRLLPASFPPHEGPAGAPCWRRGRGRLRRALRGPGPPGFCFWDRLGVCF